MSISRKRDIRAVLADATNLLVTSKRSCAVVASKTIKSLSVRGAPRGIHTSKHVCTDFHTSGTESVASSPGLSQLIRSRPNVIQEGQGIIKAYIERNSTFTIQKAVALNIFSVSVLDGSRILEACNIASKYTGFSSQVIRRWAEFVLVDLFASTSNIDNIDDEELELQLHSNRGKHSKCESLLDNEEFQLDATKYVRENGYSATGLKSTFFGFLHFG